MSRRLLLLTHETMGAALIADRAPHPRHASRCRSTRFAVPPGADVDAALRDTAARIRALDRGEGVLVLTDVYGATPSNVARKTRRDSASTCAAFPASTCRCCCAC